LTAEIARLLQSFGREHLTASVSALLSGHDGHETRPQIKSSAADADITVQEVAKKMFDAMNRIAFAPGTTVTFYRLRQQPELADVPKQIFDQAALFLERER
jgi:hypothetical protein